jgi:hypothetical protein
LSFVRTCDSAYDPAVRAFLETRAAALAPEGVNVTKLAYAVASYVSQTLECQIRQVEPVASFLRCATESWGGTERAFAASGSDALNGATAAFAGATDAATAVRTLATAVKARHLGNLMDAGQSPEAVADEVARQATEAGDAMLRRVVSNGAVMAGFMDQIKEMTDQQSRFGNRTVTYAMEDIWCCGVLPRVPYVRDDRHPPCLSHIERVAIRTVREYHRTTRRTHD